MANIYIMVSCLDLYGVCIQVNVRINVYMYVEPHYIFELLLEANRVQSCVL